MLVWFAAPKLEPGASGAKSILQLGSGDRRIVAVSPRSGSRDMNN